MKIGDLMEVAWSSFISWAAHHEPTILYYELDTGKRFPRAPKTYIEAAIDKATGFDKEREKDIEHFVLWATDEIWGFNEAPEKVQVAILAARPLKRVRLRRTA